MKMIIVSVFILCAVIVVKGPAFADEPISFAEVLQKAYASYAGIKDYTCVLHRTDVVNGSLKEHSNVIFKYMKPFRFYMKWPKYGIEAIYAEGKYDNEMKIHGEILTKSVSVGVKPELALRYSRHTIREADIGHVLDVVDANFKKAASDKGAVFSFEGDEKLDERETWRFKATLPPDKGYYGHVINLNVDKKFYLPVKIAVYGWNMELLEQYYYEDVKINVGLTEDDFDVNNAKYSFK